MPPLTRKAKREALAVIQPLLPYDALERNNEIQDRAKTTNGSKPQENKKSRVKAKNATRKRKAAKINPNTRNMRFIAASPHHRVDSNAQIEKRRSTIPQNIRRCGNDSRKSKTIQVCQQMDSIPTTIIKSGTILERSEKVEEKIPNQANEFRIKLTLAKSSTTSHRSPLMAVTAMNSCSNGAKHNIVSSRASIEDAPSGRYSKSTNHDPVVQTSRHILGDFSRSPMVRVASFGATFPMSPIRQRHSFFRRNGMTPSRSKIEENVHKSSYGLFNTGYPIDPFSSPDKQAVRGEVYSPSDLAVMCSVSPSNFEPTPLHTISALDQFPAWMGRYLAFAAAI